jgi:ABC-type transport system involved in multi-copper enzyme maturation permease subunit
MKLLALITDTFREIYSKKVIFVIIAIEVLTLVITYFALNSNGIQLSYYEATHMGEQPGQASPRKGPDRRFKDDDSLLHELDTAGGIDSLDTMQLSHGGSSKTFETSDSLPGNTTLPASGDVMLQEIVKGQMGAFAFVLVPAILFFGIFATAGIIPSMMEKGTIDLVLSKPLSRTMLLFGRALGGVAAIGINTFLFSLALWAIYGSASGVWYFPFVTIMVGVALFGFIVLYSGILLLNVMTESWVLPMILAWFHMVVLSTFLTNREETLYTFIGSPVIRSIIDGLYYALPQVNDLIKALPVAIFSASAIPTDAVIQCTIFTVVMLALAAWRFEKKDF